MKGFSLTKDLSLSKIKESSNEPVCCKKKEVVMVFLRQMLIVITLSLLIVPVVFAADNLIKDGGFEESPHTSWGNWKDWGPGERDFDNTENVHSGNESYKATLTSSSNRWNSEVVLQEDIAGLDEGDKFEAGAYLLIPEDNPLSKSVETYLEVIFYDGQGKDPKNEVGKFQSKKYGFGKPQSNWAKLTISGIVPARAQNCKLQLVILPLPYLSEDQKSNEKYSGVIYFDDVSLIKK